MQAQNVHIKSGRLIDPKSGVDQQADVFVSEGVIQAIGHAPAGFVADRVIYAAGRVVCPGLPARHAPSSGRAGTRGASCQA